MSTQCSPPHVISLLTSPNLSSSNLSPQSMPGGFNALARMYTEIQEPMMDAAQETVSGLCTCLCVGEHALTDSSSFSCLFLTLPSHPTSPTLC